MHLNSEQFETLARKLDAQLEEVLASVLEHVARSRQESVAGVLGTVGDEADQAFAEVLQDTDNATLRHDVRELREIEAARERMARGEYGICITCGEPIGFDRLLARPAAVRCLRCQDLYEQTHAADTA